MEKGVLAALITPLNCDETIDVSSLGSLLEWVLGHNIKGVFVGGTIGEGPALIDAQRLILFKETVKIVKGRIPVLANVSDMSTRRALDLVKAAAEAKVDAVVSTSRFSFPQRTPDETFRHIKTIAVQSPLPVWFYENPATTSVTNSFESISDILKIENVRGLKYSGPDREFLARCATEFASRVPVTTGNVSDITYSATVGATGAISGIASLVPGLCAKAFEAGLRGDLKTAKQIQDAIESVYSIYGGTGWPLWPTAQKHALMRLGIIKTNCSTSPFLQFGPGEQAIVDAALEKLDKNLFS